MDDSRMEFVVLGLRDGIMEQNCEHDSANRMDILNGSNRAPKPFDQSVAFLQFLNQLKNRLKSGQQGNENTLNHSN